MHITVSVVVIMFELTGALTYILPTMIAVGVTKVVSERFGKGGIADRMIWFNGMPFLNNKEDHTFGVPVSQSMTANPTCLPATGLRLTEVEAILSDSQYQGFPIVDDMDSKILLGFIGRTELQYALDRAKRDSLVSSRARCTFAMDGNVGRSAVTPSATTPSVSFDDMADAANASSVDFSKFVDPTPLAVHPRLPLETVMELFKKLGPRVVLVEHRGRLTGLVTVKDCLKYQLHAEAHENPRDDAGVKDKQERLWLAMKRVSAWLGNRLGRLSGGRLRLGHNDGGQEPRYHGQGEVELNDRET
jgi:chloride channel 3/4/5